MKTIEQLRLAEQRRKDSLANELTATVYPPVTLRQLRSVYAAIDIAYADSELDASLSSANVLPAVLAYARALN